MTTESILSRIIALSAIAILLIVALGAVGCAPVKTHDPLMIWRDIADNAGSLD